MPKSEVTLDMLIAKWDEYALRVKANKNESFFSTLKLSDPQLDGTTIKFGIANSVQEKDFDLNRQPLLDFLRSELNNYSLELELIKNAPINTPILYSEEERLKAMVEKNPHLATLIKKFGLDI